MPDKKKETVNSSSCKGCCGGGNASGAVYGLGFLGALIYFLQHATSFGMAFLGIGKAIVWPAILVYKVIGMLGL